MSLLTLVISRDAYRSSPASDDHLLQTALQEAGVTTELVAWDDPVYDWSRPDLVLIHCTWDDPINYERFLGWVSTVARQTTLSNPAELVHWNAHKTYVRELERQGITLIPTVWLPAQSAVRLPSLMLSNQWKQVVIKPAVGTRRRQVRVIAVHSLQEGQEHLNSLLKNGDVVKADVLTSRFGIGHPDETNSKDQHP